jgi:membrane protein implicated in regulation of membrane protease activity
MGRGCRTHRVHRRAAERAGLLAGGGAPLLFVVFATFFVLAAAAAWALADRRGARSTTADAGTRARAVGSSDGIRALRGDRRLVHGGCRR